jgi:hypothetical protein
MKIFMFGCLYLFVFSHQISFAPNPSILISCFAQETSYQITYYDKLNHDYQSEIDNLLKEFDASLSTYQSVR